MLLHTHILMSYHKKAQVARVAAATGDVPERRRDSLIETEVKQ